MEHYNTGGELSSVPAFGDAYRDVPLNKAGLPFIPEVEHQSRLHTSRYGDVTVSGSAQVQLGNVIIQNYNRAGPQKSIYDVLLASLRFEQMDSRLRSVEPALPSTCRWIFSHSQFTTWADANNVQHQPFLWIKGKPGSGKSTIMKEILAWIEKCWAPEVVPLTYFFNARSPDQLEKSGLGLYRCLLHQMLSNCPGSRGAFVKKFALKVSETGNVTPWTPAELQNFHAELIKNACLPPLVILIDALDEGDEDDVRHLVQYLSRLQLYAREANYPLKVVLSSRHYPKITIEKSLSLTVEGTPEHDEDIDKYIRSELAYLHGAQFEDLKLQIRQRSAGVFLWVVLVIPALKKAYDRGKSFHDIARKLDEMPSDLHDIFSRIIFRDSEDLDKCLELLSWVLFSLQALSPEELYSALEQPSSNLRFDRNFAWTTESATRYLLHCSRGLIEVSEGPYPVVQVIHETVRDYLTCEREYVGSPAGFSSIPTAVHMLQPHLCHMSIAESCLHYLQCLRAENPLVGTISDKYPVSEYAANCWWRHIRTACTVCDEKLLRIASDFLTAHDPISRWIQACGILYTQRHNAIDFSVTGAWLSYEDFCRSEHEALGSAGNRTGNDDLVVSPLYFAASVGISELVSRVLDTGTSANALGEPLGSALTAASFHTHTDIVQTLLNNGADVNSQGGVYGNALQAACCQTSAEIVQILLNAGANVNAVGGQYRTALRAATTMRREKIVQLLLEHGAFVDDPDEYFSPLQKAAVLGHVGIAKLLLSHNADIHKKGRFGNTLTLATENDHPKMVRLLLEHGADPNEKIRTGRTALHEACAVDSQHLVQLLIEYGADVTAISDDGEEICQAAARMDTGRTRYLLRSHDRDPSPRQVDRQLERQLMETLDIVTSTGGNTRLNHNEARK